MTEIMDVASVAQAWEQATAEGRAHASHELFLRLTTLQRMRDEGLVEMVRRCERAGPQSALTKAFLRQLCCTGTIGRGGRYARRYAVAVGLRPRWYFNVLEPDAESRCKDAVTLMANTNRLCRLGQLERVAYAIPLAKTGLPEVLPAAFFNPPLVEEALGGALKDVTIQAWQLMPDLQPTVSPAKSAPWR